MNFYETRTAALASKQALAHPYLQKITSSSDLGIGLYGAMLALWHGRPFLQKYFPLHREKPHDYWRWIAWCAAQGMEESLLLQELVEWEKELSTPVALPALSHDDFWHEGFSLKMFLHGIADYGYTFAPILKKRKVRHRVAISYWRGGRHRGKQDKISLWQASFLKRKFGDLPSFIKALRKTTLDHQKSDEQLVDEWCLDDVVIAFASCVDFFPAPQKILLPPKITNHRQPFYAELPPSFLSQLTAGIAWLRALPNEKERTRVTQKIILPKKEPAKKSAAPCFPKKIDHSKNSNSDVAFGVNLFGYAHGELGIGEDLRQMAKAFQAHAIPFCIINVPLKKSFSQKDDSMHPWITNEPRYAINLFCMNGVEMTKWIIKHGLRHLENRYTIGLWPWELPRWPESCHYAFACVDEIWAISSFVAQAYSAASCPVKKMTPPVSLGKIGLEQRSDFGLPENAYLYLFCFDLHSRLARKNPWGLIRAFRKAFPKEKAQDVGLVLKVSHSHSWRWPWPLIRLFARLDSRIHLLEKNMRHAELLALYKACDCYVSLHRAEGFGRTIAEALLLGLPVVTTNFSGNLDFCQEPRVILVKSKQQQLKAHDYFWGEGQYWADPCLEEASRALKKIRFSPHDNLLNTIDLSPEYLGHYYAERLKKIASEVS